MNAGKSMAAGACVWSLASMGHGVRGSKLTGTASLQDIFGAVGGIRVLKEKYDLVPDAISGVCSSSPLHIRELKEFTDIPVFNSAAPDLNELSRILV